MNQPRHARRAGAVIFTALATVLDARRASAVTLALGATPQQVRARLVMAQVIPALPGAILGLPLGLGLFKAAAHGLNGLPPVLWLAAAVLGTRARRGGAHHCSGTDRPPATRCRDAAGRGHVMPCGWQPLMPSFQAGLRSAKSKCPRFQGKPIVGISCSRTLQSTMATATP